MRRHDARNIRRLPWIWEHWPEAQAIHVIRDGRDVVCSLRVHPQRRRVDRELVPFERTDTLQQLIDRWVADIRAGIAHRGDPRYTEVRYEDLVERPEATLRILFAFLGEPWDDRVLAYRTTPDPTRATIGDDTLTAGGQAEAGAIHARSRGRWRTDLMTDEQAVFRDRAGDLLVELGYEADLHW